MRRLLLKLIRDNEFTNLLFRTVIKVFSQFAFYEWIANRYRVYGKIKLLVAGVRFMIFSKADDHIANELFYGKDYELNEFHFVKQVMQQCNYFIDVGANTGIYSLFAAACNESCSIFSFEPHPVNFERLKLNISLNGFDLIHPIEKAVGHDKSTIQFVIGDPSELSAVSSVNSGFANEYIADSRSIKLSQTTLDIELKDLSISSRDLIKIDVEYYEYNVLLGAINTLAEKRPIVLIEMLDYASLVSQFPSMSGEIRENHSIDIKKFFEGLEYRCYGLSNQGLVRVTDVSNLSWGRNFVFVPCEQNYDFLANEKEDSYFNS